MQGKDEAMQAGKNGEGECMKIMWFCIPAFGHTNPTLEVVRVLSAHGHKIRYYSFDEFADRIEEAGAQFISLDEYLPPLDESSVKRMRRVSSTEMSVRSFEITAVLDPVIKKEIDMFQPDLIVTDSACFWGKLTAMKYNLPMVCSTTTFAYNEYSSRYLKYSVKELADLLFGLPRVNRAMRKLEPLGYHVKNALDLIQNHADTDTIVYTSKKFQPRSDTFDETHYHFVGPSLKYHEPQAKKPDKPLIYISLGTVINDMPWFYNTCIRALGGEPYEVLISCGKTFDMTKLSARPNNIRVSPYVDQMDVLSRASLFITHCGMNSATEGLYMGVPELLFPITGEQQAVAGQVYECGAGMPLPQDAARDPEKMRQAVREALKDESMKESAIRMREDFLSCGGPKEAADFIESRWGLAQAAV